MLKPHSPLSLVQPAEEPVEVAYSTGYNLGIKVPEPPPETVMHGRWIPQTSDVVVGDIPIRGGLFYLGTEMNGPLGGPDPCLIDPTKRIEASGVLVERHTSYWPSYRELSPLARHTYLTWLTQGREDPAADLGYVFLYFYGLERRVIYDGPKDAFAASDYSAIELELQRLRTLYGGRSSLFREATSELLQLVRLVQQPQAQYTRPPPAFTRSWELPLELRLALGQAAKDQAPLPAEWAQAWVAADPEHALRTPATRCPEQFAKVFKALYSASQGAGMVLPQPSSKLKYHYRPLSPVFRHNGEIQFTVEGVPNVAVLHGNLRQLRDLAEQACVALEGYSRFVGRSPTLATTLDAQLLLPPIAWTESFAQALDLVQTEVGGGPQYCTLESLLNRLGKNTALTREQAQLLGRALQSRSVSTDPTLSSSSKPPSLNDSILLFSGNAEEEKSDDAGAYVEASIILQATSGVLKSGEQEQEQGRQYLLEQVATWSHLSEAQRTRLSARICVLSGAENQGQLRKIFQRVPAGSRESVAGLLVGTLLSQGPLQSRDLISLEKLYRLLELDPRRVFSEVHATATGGAPNFRKPVVATSSGPSAGKFSLDEARIATLQEDSEKTAALLAEIFNEEGASVEEAASPPSAPDEAPTGASLFVSLDSAHRLLAHSLLTRPVWQKAEVEQLASEFGLMLEGALELLNEAAFDEYSIPFTEGDDPYVVSPELLEKVVP